MLDLPDVHRLLSQPGADHILSLYLTTAPSRVLLQASTTLSTEPTGAAAAEMERLRLENAELAQKHGAAEAALLQASTARSTDPTVASTVEIERLRLGNADLAQKRAAAEAALLQASTTQS